MNRPKRVEHMTVAFLFLLPLPQVALCHPMGNASINHYSGIEVSPSEIKVDFIIDMAELPSYHEMVRRVDGDRDQEVSPEEKDAFLKVIVPELVRELSLELNGRALGFEITRRSMQVDVGVGYLPLYTIYVELRAEVPQELLKAQNVVHYEDSSYGGDAGWKEIFVQGWGGAKVFRSSVKSNLRSRRLSDYPQEFLMSPPTDTDVTFAYAVTGQTSLPVVSYSVRGRLRAPKSALERAADRLITMIKPERPNPWVVAGALFLAMLMGARHALTPGHGKVLVAAYLVGSRGTVSQAVTLGLVTTLTHTLAIFALAVLAARVLPGRVIPWVAVAAGLVVMAMGIGMLARRLPLLLRSSRREHVRSHPHGKAHNHEHGPPSVRRWQLLSVGMIGGMVPCPGALILLLSAVALHKANYGIMLVACYSLGLGVVLTLIAVITVAARGAAEKVAKFKQSAMARILPVISACFVLAYGCLLSYLAFRLLPRV
jgi:nickel/cobalt exporter